MRVSVLALTAIGAGSCVGVWAVPASAQDIRYDWTGVHVGISLGLGSSAGAVALDYPEGTAGSNNVYFSDGNFRFSSETNATVLSWPEAFDLEGMGPTISVDAGFDYQLGSVVVGAVVDSTYLGTSGMEWASGLVDDVGLNHSLTVSANLDQIYSLRSRVGIGIDRLLLFGTGGLAAGRVDMSTGATLVTDNGKGTASWEGESSDWRMGFMAGAGAEYALTDNISIKTEALYYDLGTSSVSATGEGTFSSVAQDVAPFQADVAVSGAIVRGGLSLRF